MCLFAGGSAAIPAFSKLQRGRPPIQNWHRAIQSLIWHIGIYWLQPDGVGIAASVEQFGPVAAGFDPAADDVVPPARQCAITPRVAANRRTHSCCATISNVWHGVSADTQGEERTRTRLAREMYLQAGKFTLLLELVAKLSDVGDAVRAVVGASKYLVKHRSAPS